VTDAASGRLPGRIALITGASRGIGRAVALRFAEEGAEVILVARTQGALEEADDAIRQSGRSAVLVPGDLTDPDFADRIAAAIAGRWGRLDVLVGNAGDIGTLGPVAHTSPKEWDEVMALNLTANWRLLRNLDALLRVSDAGRAVFVTCEMAAGRAYWGPYAAAKAGLESLVRSYAAEVANTTVRANLIDPGPTRTRLRAHAYPGEDPSRLPPPEAVTDGFVTLATADCRHHGDIIRSGVALEA